MTSEAMVKKLLANVADLNIGNLLKCADYFMLKEKDKDKLDVNEFFDEFIKQCFSACHKCDDYKYFLDLIIIAVEHKTFFNKTGANKQQVFDDFLLTIKEVSL